MRVNTENGLVFDLGLTGKEHQEAFTDEKYRALAGGSPAGKALQLLVDAHWLEWLELKMRPGCEAGFAARSM